MHEYSIAYDIYSTAKKAAEEHHAQKIKRVIVDIGELAMANPDQVKFLFNVIVEGDPLFLGSDLFFRQIGPQVRCRCGYEGKEIFICPKCGGLPEMLQGREIVVSNIEIEVKEA
jgi:hydrogenase nickel incorporation protein HypA/HybF